MKDYTAIIKSDSGNIFSVQNALDRINEKNIITADPEIVSNCSRLILPGVGTFGRFMKQLSELSCLDLIEKHISLNKPILGICVGMQIMMERGSENGEHLGLNLIRGDCVHLTEITDKTHKTPSIGWKEVSSKNTDWFGSKFSSTFYHVHSYAVVPNDATVVIGTYDYYGKKIPTFLAKNKIFGAQFHPERSGIAGLEFLKKFCTLT